MKFLFEWFVLFMLVTLVFGWAEVGLAYLFSMSILENTIVFWPMLGIAMTVNLLASLGWMMICQAAEEKKASESKRGEQHEPRTTSR